MNNAKAVPEKIIVIFDGPRESIARDIGTVASVLILWSVGYWAQSPALEWVGVMLGLLFLTLTTLGIVSNARKNSSFTPTELRKWLDENYPEGQRRSDGSLIHPYAPGGGPVGHLSTSQSKRDAQS